MKRFLLSLVTLCLLALPALPERLTVLDDVTSPQAIRDTVEGKWFHYDKTAWFIGGGQLQGFHVGGGPPPSITFEACTVDLTDTTAYTFSSHDVGAAGSRKTIVGVIAVDGASVFGVSSITVGGAAATEVIDEDGTGLIDTAIYIVDNPVGTAEDIVVTLSEAGQAVAICVGAAYNLASETAVSATADDDTAGGPMALSLNTNVNGIAFGVCGVRDGTDRASVWTGLTGQSEGAEISGETINWSAAHLGPTASATPLSTTCDWTAGANNASGVTAHFQ